MKPITNLLLLVALACYVFLPLFEISLVGNITGLQFTASMISAQQGAQYTAFVLIPFITIFLAIGFNSLKNRYWGIVVALLIFVTLYFFANVASMFQGFSLSDDPSVTSADVEMAEGMPVAGLGSGFYVSLVLTVLALLSALVSLMPFKFNKRLEESLDKRFVESKRHISKVGHKVGHEIHDEWNKIEVIDRPYKTRAVTACRRPRGRHTLHAQAGNRRRPLQRLYAQGLRRTTGPEPAGINELSPPEKV